MEYGEKELQLCAAVCRTDVNAVVELLNQGASVDARPLAEDYTYGTVPDLSCLHKAVESGSKGMVAILLKRGATVDVDAPPVGAPLHVACAKDFSEIVTLLLDHGANVNARDARGRTALVIAIEKGNGALVGLLVQRSADVNAKYGWEDGNGRTPLHAAIASSDLDTVRLLLDNGADVNSRTVVGNGGGHVQGTAPIHVAARRGNVPIAELLLAKGADVNASEYAPLIYSGFGSFSQPWLYCVAPRLCGLGRTPLHLAVMRDHLEMTQWLLTHGTRSHTRDLFGLTAYDYAIEQGNSELCLLFRSVKAERTRWWLRRRHRAKRRELNKDSG